MKSSNKSEIEETKRMEVNDKMWKHEAINIRAVLDNLDKELEELGIEAESFREIALTLDSNGQAAVNLLCCNIEQIVIKWSKYTVSYNEAVEKDITTLEKVKEELEEKITKAEKNNEELSGYCKRIEEDNERLRKELEAKDYNKDKIINEAARLMSLIDGRINLIANSKAVFERQKKLKLSGEESPRFKRDIDTDTLVNMYVASGYKLTHDILQYYKERGIKITYDGLRKRLINAKVWKQGQ